MNRDVVLAEWRRSTQSLQAGELLAREDYREDAVSRACCSVLHAAKAALLVHDVATASHAGVPIEEYRRMVASLEDAEDCAAIDRALGEYEAGKTVSGEVVHAILDGT